MDKPTHEMRLAQWTAIIRECRNSGKSNRAWCKENSINEKQFYYWQRRIRNEVFHSMTQDVEKKQHDIIPLPMSSIPSSSALSVSDAILRIGKYTLELSNTTSEELLLRVVRVINYVE